MRIALCFTVLSLVGCKNPLVVKEYLNLVSLSPGQGATQVAVDTQVIAGFSEPLIAKSVDSQSAYITDLEGSPVVAEAIYETDAHWIVLDPESDLLADTTYVVTFTSAIRGKHAGNLLAPVQAQFTTAGTNPANGLPTANAGTDAEVTVGSSVTIDGTGSSDPEGNPLSYAWRLVSAPATASASLSAETGPETILTPDVEGEYIAGLIVNDGTQDSSEDFIVIRALGESPDDSPTDTGEASETDSGTAESDTGSSEVEPSDTGI